MIHPLTSFAHNLFTTYTDICPLAHLFVSSAHSFTHLSFSPIPTDLPSRVRHVLELLSRTALRGGSRLHVPQATVSHPLPHPEPPVRLRFRLDHSQAEERHRRRPCRGKPAGTRGRGRCWLMMMMMIGTWRGEVPVHLLWFEIGVFCLKLII